MKAGIVLAGLALLSTASIASACGDKFIVRIDRHSRALAAPLASAPRRATILVYRPTEAGRVPRTSDIDLLKRVGHEVLICDTATRCVTALNSGAVQLVLADSRDLENLGIDETRAKAHVLPVVSKASPQDLKKLKGRFGTYFDSGAPAGKLLAMVDHLLAE